MIRFSELFMEYQYLLTLINLIKKIFKLQTVLLYFTLHILVYKYRIFRDEKFGTQIMFF